MSTYTVHQPPLQADESAPDPERFVFVRDGFSFWAFLLTPLWMLRYRLWLVFVGYLVVAVGLQVGLRALGAAATAMAVVGVLLSLLVGFEAATLRRFTLARRRWKNVGVVVGDDRETAERRFFDAWVKAAAVDSARVEREPRPTPQAAPPPISRRPPAGSEVIGLFPQPGAPR